MLRLARHVSGRARSVVGAAPAADAAEAEGVLAGQQAELARLHGLLLHDPLQADAALQGRP